jgi:hypothetical protein
MNDRRVACTFSFQICDLCIRKKNIYFPTKAIYMLKPLIAPHNVSKFHVNACSIASIYQQRERTRGYVIIRTVVIGTSNKKLVQ